MEYLKTDWTRHENKSYGCLKQVREKAVTIQTQENPALSPSWGGDVIRDPQWSKDKAWWQIRGGKEPQEAGRGTQVIQLNPKRQNRAEISQ